MRFTRQDNQQAEIYPKYMLPDGAWTTDPGYALRIWRKSGSSETQLESWLGEHYIRPGQETSRPATPSTSNPEEGS